MSPRCRRGRACLCQWSLGLHVSTVGRIRHSDDFPRLPKKKTNINGKMRIVCLLRFYAWIAGRILINFDAETDRTLEAVKGYSEGRKANEAVNKTL